MFVSLMFRRDVAWENEKISHPRLLRNHPEGYSAAYAAVADATGLRPKSFLNLTNLGIFIGK